MPDDMEGWGQPTSVVVGRVVPLPAGPLSATTAACETCGRQVSPFADCPDGRAECGMPTVRPCDAVGGRCYLFVDGEQREACERSCMMRDCR